MINARSVTSQATLRIVDKLRHRPLRFNEIERAIDAPNPVMLSKHLKKMQRDGLVVRNVIQLGPPARVEYELTPLGRDLVGPASALMGWLHRNQDEVEQARARARDAREIAHANALLADRQSDS